jgi:predicted phage terminase large subunit-like protein
VAITGRTGVERHLADNEELGWDANPGVQTAFLGSASYEALYGGAAGGGKSEALLMAATRYVDRPYYKAALFRRTFPELERSLIERSHQYYENLFGGRYNEQKKTWSFESGAKILFGHLEHERSVHDHQSAEYQYLGFDELTSFTEKQYTYMLSRARSSRGIPVRVRSATNPGGVGHKWVLRRWAPWMIPQSAVPFPDFPDFAGPFVKPGQVLYFRGSHECVPAGTVGGLSRVFIPAKVQDNPHLMHNDPDYVHRLQQLDKVTREQLLGGNWLIRPAAGEYFKRAMFKIVDAAPAAVLGRVRAWDKAATKPHDGNPDPDWTAGLRMSRSVDGLFYIEHVLRFREAVGEVEASIKATAAADGYGVDIRLAEDPAAAGKFEAAYYVGQLAGYNVTAVKETGDKVTRAKPFAAQAQAGNVLLVRGPWLEQFFEELEAFPTDGVHDDQVDAASAAFAQLAISDAAAFAALAKR